MTLPSRELHNLQTACFSHVCSNNSTQMKALNLLVLLGYLAPVLGAIAIYLSFLSGIEEPADVRVDLSPFWVETRPILFYLAGMVATFLATNRF